MIELLMALVLTIAGVFGNQLEPENPCFEDQTKVMVVAEVLPDDGQPPNVDWGTGPNVGTVLCVNSDDYPELTN